MLHKIAPDAGPASKQASRQLQQVSKRLQINMKHRIVRVLVSISSCIIQLSVHKWVVAVREAPRCCYASSVGKGRQIIMMSGNAN